MGSIFHGVCMFSMKFEIMKMKNVISYRFPRCPCLQFRGRSRGSTSRPCTRSSSPLKIRWRICVSPEEAAIFECPRIFSSLSNPKPRLLTLPLSSHHQWVECSQSFVQSVTKFYIRLRCKRDQYWDSSASRHNLNFLVFNEGSRTFVVESFRLSAAKAVCL